MELARPNGEFQEEMEVSKEGEEQNQKINLNQYKKKPKGNRRKGACTFEKELISKETTRTLILSFTTN